MGKAFSISFNHSLDPGPLNLFSDNPHNFSIQIGCKHGITQATFPLLKLGQENLSVISHMKMLFYLSLLMSQELENENKSPGFPGHHGSRTRVDSKGGTEESPVTQQKTSLEIPSREETLRLAQPASPASYGDEFLISSCCSFPLAEAG